MDKNRAELIRKKLKNYDELDLRGGVPDPVGWIAFHFGCSRRKAETMIRQAKEQEGSDV